MMTVILLVLLLKVQLMLSKHADRFSAEMTSRFEDGEIERCGLLLLVPKSLLAPRYNNIPEEPFNSIMAAVKKYKDDLTDSDNLALETEMEVWKQYW